MEVVWQVHLGQYFVDIKPNISNTSAQNLQRYRSQWSRKGLVPSLNEALTTLPKPQKIHFEFESFDRLFTSRLGGSVAQFYFQDLKDELFLHQPSSFKLNRRETLGSPDLTLSWSAALENPEKALKHLSEKSAKRVVVLGPIVSEKEKSFLESLREKYQVFVSPSEEINDKRSTLLMACLQGGLLELEESLLPIKTAHPEISFYFKRGSEYLEKPDHTLSHWNSVFCREETIPVLYFGFETWGVISPHEISREIETPWGPVVVLKNNLREFSLQPSQEWKGFDLFETLNSEELGYDPGPMCMGRGLKPQIVDFYLSQNLGTELDLPEVQAAGRAKFKNFIEAMSRQLSQLSSLNMSSDFTLTAERVTAQLTQELAFEAVGFMKAFSTYKVAGPLSPYIMKTLEPVLKSLNLKRELEQ